MRGENANNFIFIFQRKGQSNSKTTERIIFLSCWKGQAEKITLEFLNLSDFDIESSTE